MEAIKAAPARSEQPRSRLRRLLTSGVTVAAVGAFDALTARLVERAGFPAVHVGGYGLSAAQLGLPDVGLLTMTEMLDCIRRICAATDAPVIADGDTAYGNHLNADRLVRELERAGASAVHIEDQAFPKRCGHMEGKRLASAQEMIDKIRAAVDARSDPDFIVIARTDAIAVTGFEDAIERGLAYREAGADVIFVEAPETDAQVRDIPRRVPAPTLFNASWDGKSPLPSFAEIESYGYRIVLYPDTIFAATRAVTRMLDDLKATGRYMDGTATLVGFQDFNDIVGLPRIEALDIRYRHTEDGTKTKT